MNFLQKLFFPQQRVQSLVTQQVGLQTAVQKRELENILWRVLYQFRGQNTPSWMADDPHKYISRGYATNGDLFSVIETILTEAGAIDWVLEKKTGNDWKRVEAHPILDYWQYPNPWQSSTEFVQSAMGYSLLVGNSFIYKPTLSAGLNQGQAMELHVLPAPLVRIVFSGDYRNPYKGYTIEYAPSVTETIAASDVIHIKDWNPIPDEQRDLYGMSPLRALLTTIERSNASDVSQTSQIRNYGPPGIIGPDYANLDAERLEPYTEEQLKEQKRAFKKSTGPENAGIPLFASLPWKWQSFGLSPAELKILEAQQVDLRKMCNAYGVPFRLLNDGAGGTYNNMEQDMKRLYTRAVLPRMYRLGEKLTRGWIHAGWGTDYRLRPDTNGIEILQKNMGETADWLAKAWWLKGSTKQAIMGHDPDPDMDVYFVPTNLQPFTSLEDAYAHAEAERIVSQQSQQTNP